MCRLVVAFMADDKNRSPMQILRDQGHAKWNWYKWQKEYPGFLLWWNIVIEDTIKDEHLSRLYLALHKRALTHDTGAAKLIAQRFDPKYVERSSQDQRMSFKGYEPAAADSSRARQRKVLAERASKLLPAAPGPEQGPEVAEASQHTIDQPKPAQASTRSAEHMQDIDKTLDSEPITKVDPGAGV